MSASALIVSGNSLSTDGQEFRNYANCQISKIFIVESPPDLEYLLSPIVCKTVLPAVKEYSSALVGKPRHR